MKELALAILILSLLLTVTYAPGEEQGSNDEFRSWATQNGYIEKAEDMSLMVGGSTTGTLIDVFLKGASGMDNEEIRRRACSLASAFRDKTGYEHSIIVGVLNPSNKEVKLIVLMEKNRCIP